MIMLPEAARADRPSPQGLTPTGQHLSTPPFALKSASPNFVDELLRRPETLLKAVEDIRSPRPAGISPDQQCNPATQQRNGNDMSTINGKPAIRSLDRGDGVPWPTRSTAPAH